MEISNETLRNDLNKFIYVPSINLYIAKEKTLLGKSWNECQEILHFNNQRMPTIPEFKEFLKYTKQNCQDIYTDITEIRSPWRSEWLDAAFNKVPTGNVFANYHVFENGKIVRKSEILDLNTLMKDKTPGISLEDWINLDQTKQGLPYRNLFFQPKTASTKEGDLYYKYPRSDNNSATWFFAYPEGVCLDCDGSSSYEDLSLGVRAVKQRE